MSKRRSINLVARRYARSLFRIDGEAKAERYLVLFSDVASLFANKEARKILLSPVMPAHLKQDLLELVFNEDKVDDQFKNFIKNLVIANRVDLLPEIGMGYQECVIDGRNQVSAEIISAHILESNTQQQIESHLQSIFKKKILLNLSVDSNLLGGFVIRVGNFLLDYSLKSKVDQMMANI